MREEVVRLEGRTSRTPVLQEIIFFTRSTKATTNGGCLFLLGKRSFRSSPVAVPEKMFRLTLSSIFSTAATRSAPLIRRRRRSHRSPPFGVVSFCTSPTAFKPSQTPGTPCGLPHGERRSKGACEAFRCEAETERADFATTKGRTSRSGLTLSICPSRCLCKRKCLPNCFGRCIRHRRRSLAVPSSSPA